MAEIRIIGAGLAGCEAAWQAANRGVNVTLCEMKPKKFTPAHHSENFAELVCSNSLRSNELSNAVKPVVIPGENMRVTVVKSGKEPGQGVAYLDDGTMIVIEGGHRFMNETIDVEVTSALQTAAGRMIFAKPKN